MREASYRFFCNTNCEYYPCHDNASGGINCLFCYCPLYTIDICPGEFIISDTGSKDCSQCAFPHDPDNYDTITSLLRG